MNELKEKLDKLRTDQAKEEKKLKEEYKIMSLVSKRTTQKPKIFISDLYGVKAWVTFGESFNNQGLNQEDLVRLLQTFKPYHPKYMCRDGCLSFQPQQPKKNKYSKVTEVYPVTLKWHGFDQHLSFNWYYKLKPGLIVEIKCIVTDYSLINRFMSVSYERKIYKGWFEIFNTRVIKLPSFRFQSIKWGSGGREYPNNITAYSLDVTGWDILDLFKNEEMNKNDNNNRSD